MNEITFNLARDFSVYPGGRFRRDGPHSGEELRDKLVDLIKRATQEGVKVRVILDGAAGYGASFLEEAFGGLVRNGNFTVENLGRVLVIEAKNAVFRPYKDLAEKYIREAKDAVAA